MDKYPAIARRLAFLPALLILTFIFPPQRLWAGECITSDSELLEVRRGFYQSAKTRGIGEFDGNWGLRCWRYDEGLDEQLKELLVEMMSDSRIHPAYVADAANDYFFSDREARLKRLPTLQGPARYALIRPLLESTMMAPQATAQVPLGEGEVDFIDGPAQIRNAPKGKKIATLPDNSKVRIYQERDGWVEIQSGKVRGWTSQTNLMGHVVGKQPADAFPILSRAAFMGYLETVDFLLRQGADVNVTDRFGRNALHWAVLGTSFNLGGVEREILNKLCASNELDINRRDSAGETPLLMAVKQQDLLVIEALLAVSGVDANLADSGGTTPFSYAVGSGRQEIFDALLKATPKIAVNAPNGEGETLLAIAVRDRPRFVPQLLKLPDIDIEQTNHRGETPLFQAVANRDSETVRLLLEHGAKVDVIDREGNNLLHAYLDNRNPYRGDQGSELFEMLVKDPRVAADRPNTHGTPPLYRAVSTGWFEGVRMLLTRSDVDVNRRFKNGGFDCDDSYLRLALDTRGMALLLLDREDIDVNVEITRDHMTPIFFPDNMWRGEEYSLAIAEKILAHKPNLELESEYGETPLTYNIKNGNIVMVKLLLKAGADINHSRNGTVNGTYFGPSMTPLKYAEKWGKADIVALLKQAGAQDYQLLGDPEMSPEGIPQQLLQNEPANEAIRRYRGYLVDTTNAVVESIAAGDLDKAIRRQEFILDEIVAEVGASMPEFSQEQRKLAQQMFTTIQAYYESFPRSGSKWFQELPEEKKQYYTQLDTERATMLSRDYSSIPEGNLVDHPPMVPILILRNYMACNSINALEMIRQGKADKAARMLSDVAAKSQAKF